MKTRKYRTLPICVLGVLLGAPRNVVIAASRNQPSDEQSRKEFEQHRSGQHPWKKEMSFPRSYADAGLLSDAAMVWSGLYADGGTRGFLLMDSSGKFLAICTGPGFQSKDMPNRIEGEVGSRLFLGSLHYTDKGAEIVPAKGEAEIWLRTLLVKKEANKSPEPTSTAVTPRATEAKAK